MEPDRLCFERNNSYIFFLSNEQLNQKAACLFSFLSEKKDGFIEKQNCKNYFSIETLKKTICEHSPSVLLQERSACML